MNLGNECTHTFGHIQRVGGGIANHAGTDGRHSVEAYPAALAGGSLLNARNIAQAHGKAVDCLDRDVIELCHGIEVGACGHAELTLFALNPPRRHLQVLPTQGVLHVLYGQAIASQTVRVEPHAHGITAIAAHLHIGHAWHRLQARFHDAVDQVSKLQRAHRLTGIGQPDGGRGIGLHFADDRLIGRIGQAAAHAGHTVPHFGSGGIRVFA